MDALILGAGRVGSELARVLVGNSCNVTVVDTKIDPLLALQASFDLQTVQGSAANPNVLRRAGAADADIVVAVTEIDEINLVACKLCTLLSEKIKKIARVRNNYYNDSTITDKNGFGIDHVFFPEQIIAENFCNAVTHAGCLSVNRFADGKMVLAGVRISSKADIVGETVETLRSRVKEIDYRIVSIYRDDKPVPPDADTRLFVGDELYLLVEQQNLHEITPFLAGPQSRIKRLFIAGGGNIGRRVAAELEKNHEIKLVEINHKICAKLSEQLNKTLILKGRATDEKLLLQEGVSETDMFCALTNDDEENILSAILAKRLGARQTAALVNRAAYVEILQRQLDIVLSPSQITIGSVLAHIRPTDVNVVHSLRQGAAEAVEAVVHGDTDTSMVVGREVQQIEWPTNAMPGAIVRDEQIFIAHHHTVINDGDRLIFFVSETGAAKKMENLLTEKKTNKNRHTGTATKE